MCISLARTLFDARLLEAVLVRLAKVSAAKRELAEIARGHAEKALQVLVDIATSGESEAARVSAANAILDRGYGKPPQAIDHKSSDGSMSPTRIEIVAATDANSADTASS